MSQTPPPMPNPGQVHDNPLNATVPRDQPGPLTPPEGSVRQISFQAMGSHSNTH
jgi:hypothetical protein